MGADCPLCRLIRGGRRDVAVVTSLPESWSVRQEPITTGGRRAARLSQTR